MSESENTILLKTKEILQNAEIFEVWFYDEKVHEASILQKLNVKFDSDYLEFSANKVAGNLSGILRENLIESFFRDVDKGGAIARCFIPHHGIKAVYKNISLEIAICYMCSLFRGQISEQTFGGSFPEEELSESKKIFDEILEKYSVDVR